MLTPLSRWSPGPSVYSVILRPTWPLQAAALALGLLLPALAVVPLDLQRRIIDDAIPSADMGLLGTLAAIYVAAIGLRAGLKFAVHVLRGRIAAVVERVLRVTLISARRRARGREGTRSLGAATSVMTAEVEPIGGFAAEALTTPMIQGATLLAVAGFMLANDLRLAAIGIAALATEAVITPVIQHWINMLTFWRIRALRRAGHHVISAAHRGAGRALVPALHEVRRTYRLRLAMVRLKAALKVLRNLIDNLAEIAVLGVGAAMVAAGETQIGVVVAFLAALRRVREPWSELVTFYRSFADARVKYRLVRAQLLPEATGPVTAPRGRPRRDGDRSSRDRARAAR